MLKALVKYTEGQTDEEGNPVSSEPFTVEYNPWDGDTREEAIAYTGDVQFGWELLAVL